MVRTGGSFWYSFGITDKKQVANMRAIRKARRYPITVNKVDANKHVKFAVKLCFDIL